MASFVEATWFLWVGAGDCHPSGHDIAVTSEWGTPNMVENGANPDLLLAGKYGHAIHIWDLRKRRHLQSLDLGAEQQLVLELRPAHDPAKPRGWLASLPRSSTFPVRFGCGTKANGSSNGCNGSKGKFEIKKVIEIPAEPADPEQLPPLLKGFKAVPPLLTDTNLSVDDRFLYASC